LPDLRIVRILFGMTHRLEESAGLGGRVSGKSDREVRPTKGGEELEAGRGQRSDPYRVNERIGNQPPGEQAVTGCRPISVERGEHRDAEQGNTVEAVEALRPAGVTPE
jgi:hypothetical protein